MTFTFKLSRRMARFRATVIAALLVGTAACNTADSFAPDSSSPVAPEGAPDLASTSFAGGIPFGFFAQPVEAFGARYNGAHSNISPNLLLEELAAIRARGGRVILMFAGSQPNYKDAAGHFDFGKWKARIDRYKGIDFSSFLSDGTIVGHYLIDEPYDPFNWNGQAIPGTMVEEMAKYSKSIWPGMTTIARSESYFLGDGPFRYLDAAWAQYRVQKGDINAYLAKNLADAQKKGLGLVVGLNTTNGGTDKAPMTASQVSSFGATMLSSSYPCAFINWQYEAGYAASSAIGSAMDGLRAKAQNRTSRRCDLSSDAPPPPPEPAPTPPPPPPPPPPAGLALPFGLSHTPIEAYSTRWSGAHYRAEPADLVKQLDRAKATQMRLIVVLAKPADSKAADGTFSLTKWKEQVDRYRSLPLGSYITGKTFYLHHLVDQPDCASCWGGKPIPWATVEAMAKYSKSIWPNLPTSVRVPPSTLAAASFRWVYLDAGWAQYETRRGDLKTWLAAQVAQAKSEGLGLVTGLNLMDATGLGSAPMTASQIQQFGTVLAREPSACAFMAWQYDPTILSQTAVGTALDAVAAVAKGRNAGSCVVN